MSHLKFLLAYSYYVHTYYSKAGLPHLGNCSGTESAALLGCGVITSYLGLFVKFYIQTYKKPVRGKAVNGVTNGNGNGVASGNGHTNGNGYTNGSA